MAKELIDYLASTKQTTTTTDPMQAYFDQAKTLVSKMGTVPSAGNIQNYYGQAQSMLGGVDTAGFDQLRSSLDQQYTIAQQGLKTEYDRLLQSLAEQGVEAKEQFGEARGTIMENSFDRNRDMYRALAARGLGSSGLAQLGAVQQRMETGRQVSGVAQQYYGAEEAIAQAKEAGTGSYTQQQAAAQAGYQQNLASLASQEIQYKNAYQQQLASLALQLQGNAQAQANAAYSAQQSKLSAELGLLGQEAQYKASTGSELDKAFILQTYTNTADRVAAWSTKFNVSTKQAAKEVAAYEKQYGDYVKQDFVQSIDIVAPRIGTEAQKNAVMSNISNAYMQGTIDYNDAYAIIEANFDKLANPQYWSGYDAQQIRLLSQSGQQDAVIKNILRLTGIEK